MCRGVLPWCRAAMLPCRIAPFHASWLDPDGMPVLNWPPDAGYPAANGHEPLWSPPGVAGRAAPHAHHRHVHLPGGRQPQPCLRGLGCLMQMTFIACKDEHLPVMLRFWSTCMHSDVTHSPLLTAGFARVILTSSLYARKLGGLKRCLLVVVCRHGACFVPARPPPHATPHPLVPLLLRAAVLQGSMVYTASKVRDNNCWVCALPGLQSTAHKGGGHGACGRHALVHPRVALSGCWE